MDHQWGSVARLDIGWDWINLQLDDGSDLMAAVVWTPQATTFACKDESCPPPTGERVAAYATYIDPDGSVVHVPGEGVAMVALDSQVSPKTAIRYPSTWRLQVAPLAIDLLIAPVVVNAEFGVGEVLPVAYWEGAVTAMGASGDSPVAGRGFVELVGYDPNQTAADIPLP